MTRPRIHRFNRLGHPCMHTERWALTCTRATRESHELQQGVKYSQTDSIAAEDLQIAEKIWRARWDSNPRS